MPRYMRNILKKCVLRTEVSQTEELLISRLNLRFDSQSKEAKSKALDANHPKPCRINSCLLKVFATNTSFQPRYKSH